MGFENIKQIKDGQKHIKCTKNLFKLDNLIFCQREKKLCFQFEQHWKINFLTPTFSGKEEIKLWLYFVFPFKIKKSFPS